MKNSLKAVWPIVVMLTGLVSVSGQAFIPADLQEKNKNDFSKYLYEQFPKYPSAVVHTYVKPQVKLIKGTEAYKYRTEIRRQFAQNGINFAGKYSLINVGCGTSCNRLFLVHGVNGEVLSTPIKAESGFAYYSPDSHLLYIGPDRFQNFEQAQKDPIGQPRLWALKEEKLETVEIKYQGTAKN